MNVYTAFAMQVNETELWGLRCAESKVLAHGRYAGDVIGVAPEHALLLVFSRCAHAGDIKDVSI